MAMRTTAHDVLAEPPPQTPAHGLAKELTKLSNPYMNCPVGANEAPWLLASATYTSGHNFQNRVGLSCHQGSVG
jgi:hypothetical protein